MSTAIALSRSSLRAGDRGCRLRRWRRLAATATRSDRRRSSSSRADAICKTRATQEIEAASNTAQETDFAAENAEPSDEQAIEFTDTVIVPEHRASRSNELRALGAPEGDEEQVDAILDALEEAHRSGRRRPERRRRQAATRSPRSTSWRTDYGLNVCGEDDAG